MKSEEGISLKAGVSQVCHSICINLSILIPWKTLEGIAFRMAQDLGFQKDPKHWVSHDSSLATEEDLEIRRRIFWGCYSSDKLISLILGRPVYLFYDDAEVDTTHRLP